jgi:hypothetical protein
MAAAVLGEDLTKVTFICELKHLAVRRCQHDFLDLSGQHLFTRLFLMRGFGGDDLLD